MAAFFIITVSMENIAVFVKNLTIGGAEKQSVLLAKALANAYRIHYIIFNGAKVHQKYLDMLRSDEKIAIIAFKGGLVQRYQIFVDYLKSNKIEAIFSYLSAANVYACLAGKQVGAKVYTGLRNAKLPLGKHLADCFLANNLAEKAIVNCYSGKKNFVSKGFNNKKVWVIPNCFEHIKPYVEKTKKDKVHIITVGRFVKQKDYETAIRVVAELRKECPNVIFNIVGYGELEKQIRMWVRSYGIEDITNIHLNPPHIPQLLDGADIYMSTSLFEGTSNSIMEGMNADLPIVATNVGDNEYLVEHGVNGLLCEVGDFKGISRCLIRLVKDVEERTSMGRQSKQKLQKHYSIEQLGQKYINLIEGRFNEDVG